MGRVKEYYYDLIVDMYSEEDLEEAMSEAPDTSIAPTEEEVNEDVGGLLRFVYKAF